jgi:hypothetical protein
MPDACLSKVRPHSFTSHFTPVLSIVAQSLFRVAPPGGSNAQPTDLVPVRASKSADIISTAYHSVHCVYTLHKISKILSTQSIVCTAYHRLYTRIAPVKATETTIVRFLESLTLSQHLDKFSGVRSFYYAGQRMNSPAAGPFYSGPPSPVSFSRSFAKRTIQAAGCSRG